MNKKIGIILLLSFLMLFTACASTNNEIYNTSYEGTISLNDFEGAVQAVVKTSKDSVIAFTNYDQSLGGISLQAIGSGFIYEGYAVTKDEQVVSLEDSKKRIDILKYVYHAITNSHVVSDADLLRTYYKNEEIHSDILCVDEYVDLAIVEFDTTYYIPVLKLADSEFLQTGSFVLAIGCPEGLEYYGTCTFGIVSSPKRYIEEEFGFKKVINEYIQHDAAINSGNSGGPLINMKGEVVGINTWKYMEIGVEGMGFSIPSNVVKDFIASYEKDSEL